MEVLGTSLFSSRGYFTPLGKLLKRRDTGHWSGEAKFTPLGLIVILLQRKALRRKSENNGRGTYQFDR